MSRLERHLSKWGKNQIQMNIAEGTEKVKIQNCFEIFEKYSQQTSRSITFTAVDNTISLFNCGIFNGRLFKRLLESHSCQREESRAGRGESLLPYYCQKTLQLRFVW